MKKFETDYKQRKMKKYQTEDPKFETKKWKN